MMTGSSDTNKSVIEIFPFDILGNIEYVYN